MYCRVLRLVSVTHGPRFLFFAATQVRVLGVATEMEY